MDNEFPKEMKITPGGEEACARMRLLLKKAQDTIKRALRDDEKACKIGDNPYRFLSAAVFVLREMMRPRPGTVAFLTEITDYYCEHEPRLRLVTEPEKPAEAPQAEQKKPDVFHTPKEIIDFVTANPPLGEVKDAPTPLDPSAPEMVQGGAKASVPHRKAKFVIEIGGVEFVREVMEGFILYHGAHSTPGGHNPKQWAMEVYRSPSGVVRAVAYNGGDKPVMNISGRGNFKVLDRMAVNALGGFVRAALKPSRIHKSARRTAKAAETEGAPNV